MNILILGAGMYVTGRKNTGVGTLLAAVAESSRTMPIEKVTVAARSESNAAVVQDAANRINGILGTTLSTEYAVIDVEDEPSFVRRLEEGHYGAVIVSLPDHLHFKAAKPVLERGIHCLVVKPLTPTLEEARQLAELQKAHRAYGAVEFHKRFDETNLYTRRVIRDRQLGQLLYFTVDYSQRIDIPLTVFAAWAEKTNIFQYLGVHYVDLIYFLTGFCPRRVSAVGTWGTLREKGIETYDSVHAQILWENPENGQENVVSQFNISWVDPNISSALSDQKYKVIGTKGRLEIDQKNRGVELVQEEAGIQQINPYFSDYLENPDGQMTFGGYGYKSVNLFLQDVEGISRGQRDLGQLDRVRPSFTQSLVSTAVVDAVNKSLAANGEWRTVDDYS